MRAVSDEQLIQRVAEGDPSSLATLFERHHRGVYRYFMQMLRHRAQSEDLVQDVFLRILQKAGSFRGEGSARAYASMNGDVRIWRVPTEGTVERDDGENGVSVRIENVIVAKINGGGPVLRLKTLHGDIHIRRTE